MSRRPAGKAPGLGEKYGRGNPQRFWYERDCPRCGGSGIDPDSADCMCDCCENGTERLLLTPDEAAGYSGIRVRLSTAGRID